MVRLRGIGNQRLDCEVKTTGVAQKGEPTRGLGCRHQTFDEGNGVLGLDGILQRQHLVSSPVRAALALGGDVGHLAPCAVVDGPEVLEKVIVGGHGLSCGPCTGQRLTEFGGGHNSAVERRGAAIGVIRAPIRAERRPLPQAHPRD